MLSCLATSWGGCVQKDQVEEVVPPHTVLACSCFDENADDDVYDRISEHTFLLKMEPSQPALSDNARFITSTLFMKQHDNSMSQALGREKEDKPVDIKELLTAFVASAKEGLRCTRFHIVDNLSVFKSNVQLTVDEQLQSVCLASPQHTHSTMAIKYVPGEHWSKASSIKEGRRYSWKAPLRDCEFYGYHKAEELRPETTSLKFVAPEDQPLCIMIFHKSEVVQILAKDERAQYMITKCLQILAARARQTVGRSTTIGGA